MLLNEMEIFYYVVEFKNFSKAAEQLGVSKSFISKRMTRLEQDLQQRLFARNTRHLKLTEAGEIFYQHCIKVVAEAQNGYALLNELQGKPAGKLKISIPPALGIYLLAPLLADFIKKYPEVILNIELETRLVDVLKEGYDLVLRSAVLESSNLIAQKIFTIKNIICGTPAYFKQHGKPKVPDDLMRYNCAVYNAAGEANVVKLKGAKGEAIIAMQSNLQTNHLGLAKYMILADTCLAVLPSFMVTNELKTGKLMTCLDNYQLPASQLYAIYPEKEFMPLKLRVFLEMLKNFLTKYN